MHMCNIHHPTFFFVKENGSNQLWIKSIWTDMTLSSSAANPHADQIFGMVEIVSHTFHSFYIFHMWFHALWNNFGNDVTERGLTKRKYPALPPSSKGAAPSRVNSWVFQQISNTLLLSLNELLYECAHTWGWVHWACIHQPTVPIHQWKERGMKTGQCTINHSTLKLVYSL